MHKTILAIGNSDGIGKEFSKLSLERGYKVIGISKSQSALLSDNYRHFVIDVCKEGYKDLLTEIIDELDKIDVCVYFAGIGVPLDLNHLEVETKVFQTNLMSAVVSTEVILKKMISQKEGHFIGISSMADAIISPEAPSYCASKAGISRFWEALSLAKISEKVFITNVRFGFVDTKMAKSDFKPFMISKHEAANTVLNVIDSKKKIISKPRILIPILFLVSLFNKIRLMF